MTTVEKLLVQIFERKNSFIEQVKQQTELYSQHCASKLLIDGITPPSWLWNPNTSPDSKELNKEELISKILRPYPQPPVHCSVGHYPVYNNLAVTGYNEEFSDGVFMESMSFDNVLSRQDDPTVPALNREDRSPRVFISVPELDTSVTSPVDQADERILNIPTVPTFNREDHGPSILNSVPEPETSITSPEDQADERIFNFPTVPALTREDHSPSVLNSFPELHTSVTSHVDQADGRILNIYNAPDQSVAGIQRSKSRQKALELRNSAKALTKSGSRHENTSNVFSSQIRFSLSATNQSSQKDEPPKLAEPCVIGNQICEDRELDEADYHSEGNRMAYSGRITGSRSLSNVPINVGGSSSNVFCSQIRFSLSATNQSGQKDELPKLAKPCVIGNQICEDKELDEADYHSERNGMADSGRITRSRSLSNVPINVGGSSSNVFSSQIRFPLSATNQSGQKDELPKLAEPCVIGNQICEDKELDEADYHSEGNGMADSGRITTSQSLSNVPINVGGSSSNVFSSQIRFPLSATNQSGQRDELPKLTEPCVIGNRICEDKELDDKELDEADYHSEGNGMADSGRITRSRSLSNDSINVGGSSASGCSMSYSGKITISRSREKAPVYVRGSLTLGCLSEDCNDNSPSHIAKERRTECMPISDSKHVPLTHSDSFVYVEPKNRSFNEIDLCNLKAFTADSGKRRLGNSLESMSWSFPISAVPLDKGISGGIDQLLLGKQSPEKSDVSSKEEEAHEEYSETEPGKSDVSSKGEEAHGEYSEIDFPENPDNEAEKFGQFTCNTMVKTFEDNKEDKLDCKVSEVNHEADSTLRKMVDIPDIQIPSVKFHESLPERHIEEGEWNDEGNKGQLVSSAPESKNLRPSNCHNSAKQPRAESCGCSIEEVDVSCSQHGDSPLGDEGLLPYSAVRSNGEHLSLEKSVRQANMGSWPQLKRRKIEHQQTHCFTSSPSFRVRKPRSNQWDPPSAYLENIEINTDTVLMDTFHVNKNANSEIHQEMNSDLKEGIESAILSQNGEVEFCYEEKNGCENQLSVITNEQLEANLISSPIEESRNSQGYPSSRCIDARELGDGQCSPHLFDIEKNSENLNSENSTLTNTMLERLQSPKWKGDLQTEHSLLSPSNEVMELIDVDQSMPVLEGFIVDEQSDNDQLDYAADGIDFDKLDLPRTTIERASILAEICRSASLDKSLSHFSTSFEFRGTENSYHSVPNGHLENWDLGGTFSTTSDVGEQLQSESSSGDDYKDALEGMPYSDCIAYSAARYCWNPRNQYTSPVGKLWERLSSHTGSSEKRLSSNPELTCFPIEEDPCISEENGTVDDNADDVQEEIDSSLAQNCDNRQPLKDLSNLGLNPPMSVSAPEETFGTDSVDFVSAKSSVTGTQDKVLWSPKNQYRNVRPMKEKQTSFIGATGGRKKQTSSICTNGIRKAKESINNSISKPLLLNKTSLQKQDQNLSLKPFRRNNIVSNVSSFIPLIQQKQETTVCAGKRDVKVKALEVAEAAKRLEEKKDNERKMRKEALKVERAKMEEKNQKHMELEKKKKDAERKKKEADIISKKRLREEEERKEKEKKRMRVEARQRQREQPEKMRGEKVEKENQRSKDEQINSKKGFHNEFRNNVALEKTATKLAPTEVVMNYEECGTSGQSCEAGEAMHSMENSPKNEYLIVRNSHGNSYEISPYQCSDDEDEEDDELPTKKYVPSWASKSSVAVLLSFQQEMDPDTIFPLESFCSMDEVLLPRKLQQMQMAA